MLRKNIIANFIGRGWGVISNFVFIPLYIRYLGIESYSIISFSLIFVTLMAVLDSGLTSTLSREFAVASNTKSERIKTLKTLESCYLIIAAIIILIPFLSSDFFVDKWLKIGDLEASKVSNALKIMGVGISFEFLSKFYNGGLLGIEKQVLCNFLQIIWSVFRNCIVVVIIIFNPSIEFFFIWQTLCTIVYAVILRKILLYQLGYEGPFLWKMYFDKDVIKKVRKFAIGMLFISLVAGLNTQMDKLAISKLLPISTLGIYNLAFTLVNSLTIIVTPIFVALLPRLTSLSTSSSSTSAYSLYKSFFLITAILVLAVAIVFILYGYEICFIWTGDVLLSQQLCKYVQYLVPGTVVLAISTISYAVAIAHAYTFLNNIIGIISLAFTLPCYWIAVINYGPLGAAIVWSVSNIVMGVIYIFVINRHFFIDYSICRFLLNNFISPLAILSFLGYSTYLFRYNTDSKILMLLWILFILFILFSITSVVLIKRLRIFICKYTSTIVLLCKIH